METLTIQEFHRMMSNFDYHYQFSDDGAVWRRGEEAYNRLLAVSKESPKKAALWSAWWSYANGIRKTAPTIEEILGEDVEVHPDNLYGDDLGEETEEEADAIERKFNTDDLPEEVEAAYVESPKDGRHLDTVEIPFPSAADHSATLESAQAYLAQREGDLIKLKVQLWDNLGTIAPGWQLRRYPDGGGVVCSVKDQDVDWAKSFPYVEQALAYILAKWW